MTLVTAGDSPAGQTTGSLDGPRMTSQIGARDEPSRTARRAANARAGHPTTTVAPGTAEPKETIGPGETIGAAETIALTIEAPASGEHPVVSDLTQLGSPDETP